MQTETYFLGMDVGTNESKGVIIDIEGNVIAEASTSHGIENPKPNYFEHDADEVWYKDICILSNELIKKSKVTPDSIKGVGISALSSDCLPVDKHGKPLRKAILYGIDARATEELEILTRKWGDKEVLELFGRPIGSNDVSPKILWIRRNEPEVFKKTHKFLTGSSYLVYKLTSNYTIDRYLALSSFIPLYNQDGSVSEEYCEGICDPNQLAEVLHTTDIAGYVTEAASRDTGLAIGTPVITGGEDSSTEAISSGVITPGDLMIQLGSTVYIIFCTEKLYNDDRLWREEYVVPNTFDISAGTNTSGTLTKWIRDLLYTDEVENREKTGVNAYQVMMEEMKNIPIGSNGLITLPYFAGERTPIKDSKAKGMIFGLDLSHTKHDIMRSTYEAVCFSIKQHFDIFDEMKVPLNNVMITGGGVKNTEWIQMLADVLNREIKTPLVTIGASYGDALMAMLGTGYKSDFKDIKKLIKEGKVYKPNLENHEQYNKYYEIYNSLYQANKDLMHRLNDIE